MPEDGCEGTCGAALGAGGPCHCQHAVQPVCISGGALPAWWRPSSRRHLQVWAVSELPELGTLEDAIRIGQLRGGRTHPASRAELHRVLLTAHVSAVNAWRAGGWGGRAGTAGLRS